MFTPEFVNSQLGTYVLVANHFVETDKAVELSITYNLARIRYAAANLPKEISKCILTYDVRDQTLSTVGLKKIEAAFAHIHKLEVKR